MRNWYRLAAALALLSLVISCTSPAAVAPTPTNSSTPVNAAVDNSNGATGRNDTFAKTPITPKERAATRIAAETQNAPVVQTPTTAPAIQNPTTVAAAPEQQLGLVS
ncbi:MAG: hypothetical protein P4N59_17605, partial [Negativicutes bacterium]|nr:hypothetical protein [Negativicutes bacterium]